MFHNAASLCISQKQNISMRHTEIVFILMIQKIMAELLMVHMILSHFSYEQIKNSQKL